jgi:hypothetical protein
MENYERWKRHSPVNKTRHHQSKGCPRRCLYHCSRAWRWRNVNIERIVGFQGRRVYSLSQLITVCGCIRLRLRVFLAVVVAVCSRLRTLATLVYRSWAGMVNRGLPERGRSPTSSCCAYRWTNLSTVLRWQLKCWATSLCVLPALIIPRARRRCCSVNLGLLTWSCFHSGVSFNVNDGKTLHESFYAQGFTLLREFSNSPRAANAFSQTCNISVNVKAIFTKNADFVFSSTYSCTCYHFLPFHIVLFGVWSFFFFHAHFLFWGSIYSYYRISRNHGSN